VVIIVRLHAAPSSDGGEDEAGHMYAWIQIEEPLLDFLDLITGNAA